MSLTNVHEDYLDAGAVDPAVAAETGAYSITEKAELPEGIEFYGDDPSGIVFQRTQLDGTSSPQYRPDFPSEGGPKYIAAAGSGSVITVHPRVVDRIMDAPEGATLMVVEGTKQYLAVISLVTSEDGSEDHDPRFGGIIPVGISGCHMYGGETPGTLHPDIIEIVRRVPTISEAIICLDSDRQTKQQVWDAGKGLSDHLSSLGLKARFLDLPVGGMSSEGDDERSAAGIDDHLAALPTIEMRVEALARWLADASEKPGRRPAAKKKPKTVEVSSSVGAGGVPTEIAEIEHLVVDEVDRVMWEVGFATRPDGSTYRARQVRMEAAARIVGRQVYVEDLADAVTAGEQVVPIAISHDIEVAPQGFAAPYIIRSVPDDELADVRAWLARSPMGAGASIAVDAAPGVERRIAETLRAHRSHEATVRVVTTRTGLQPHPDGRAVGWVHAGGMITPEGTDGSVQMAPPTRTARAIRLPDEDPSTDDIRELVLGLRGALLDPKPVTIGLGMAAYAATGAPIRGSVVIAGGAGSGKTALLTALMSVQGQDFGTGKARPVPASSSEGAMVAATGGVHHAIFGLDDAKVRESARAQNRQEAGIDELVRLGYDGALRERARWDSSVGIVADDAPGHRPLPIITAETLPSAAKAGSESRVERIIGVTMDRTSSWHNRGKPLAGESVTYAETMDHAADGTYARAWGSYLRWITAQAAAQDPSDALAAIRAHVDAMETRRGIAADALAVELDGARPRLAAVPAAAIVGWWALVSWATEADAITPEEAADLSAAIPTEVAEVAREYHAAALHSVESNPIDRLLGRLRSAMAQDASIMLVSSPTGTPPSIERARVIGRRMELKDGQEVVALIPDAVEAVTRISDPVGTLRPAAIGSGGKATRPVKIAGSQVRCILVPAELFDGGGWDDEFAA